MGVDESLAAILDGCISGQGVDFRLFYRVVAQAARQVADSDADFWVSELGLGNASNVGWTAFRQKLLSVLPQDAKVRSVLLALQRTLAVDGKVQRLRFLQFLDSVGGSHALEGLTATDLRCLTKRSPRPVRDVSAELDSADAEGAALEQKRPPPEPIRMGIVPRLELTLVAPHETDPDLPEALLSACTVTSLSDSERSSLATVSLPDSVRPERNCEGDQWSSSARLLRTLVDSAVQVATSSVDGATQVRECPRVQPLLRALRIAADRRQDAALACWRRCTATRRAFESGMLTAIDKREPSTQSST